MIVAIETLAEDRKREVEKLEVTVEIGRWVARRRRQMQKECEIEDKRGVRKRKRRSR
jgi:hypothetical protein